MARAPSMEGHGDLPDKLGHVDLMPLQFRVKVSPTQGQWVYFSTVGIV